MTDTGAGVGPGNRAQVAPADKADFLRAIGSYPSERPEAVEARETHMSWVFLTDDFASHTALGSFAADLAIWLRQLRCGFRPHNVV